MGGATNPHKSKLVSTKDKTKRLAQYRSFGIVRKAMSCKPRTMWSTLIEQQKMYMEYQKSIIEANKDFMDIQFAKIDSLKSIHSNLEK